MTSAGKAFHILVEDIIKKGLVLAKGCNSCLEWLINSGCYIRAQNKKTRRTAQLSSWSFCFVLNVVCYIPYLMIYIMLDIRNAINLLQATFEDIHCMPLHDACY